MSSPRDKYIYYQETGEVDRFQRGGCSQPLPRHHCGLTFRDPAKEGAKGVLLANGGTFGGYSFFVNKDQKLQYSHNYVGITEYKVISKDKLPSGKVTVRMEFKKTGPADFAMGKGVPGVVKLFVNNMLVGEGEIATTVPIQYSLSGDGLCCGWDSCSAVSQDYMGSHFHFTGVIHQSHRGCGQRPKSKRA